MSTARIAGKHAMGALLVCALGLAGTEARAQDSAAADPEQKYREARSQRNDGEYAAALATIDQGLAAEPSHRKLLRLRADILLEKRDYAKALVAYEAFLAANPRRANKREVQKIVAGLQIVRKTFLVVEVANGPAKVYIDSRSYGEVCTAAPKCRLGIIPKSYRVYIERDGFEPLQERVEIKGNSTTRLARTLAEKKSQLTVDVDPPDAQVSLDGEVLGTGPQSLVVAAGEHPLEVSSPGFATVRQTVTAALGQPVTVRVRLAALVTVRVSGPDTESLQVLLDGQPIELDDSRLALPEPGRGYQLVIRAEGYQEATVDIPAERPADYRVDVTLERQPARPAGPVRTGPAPGWTTPQLAAVAATGSVAVIGYGLAVGLGISARGKWSDAEASCREGGGSGVVCDEDGVLAGDDARTAAGRANLAFAVGTVAAVGTLWALNLGQPAPAEGGMTLRRKLSLGGAAGVAAVGLGVGVAYGLRARSRRNTSRASCDDDGICDRDGFVAAAEALDYADVSNLGFLVAAAGAASAAVLWFTAPRATSAPGESASAPGEPAALRAVPVLGDGQVGLSVQGGF